MTHGQQIQQIARLARLKISGQQQDEVAAEVATILAWMDSLAQVQTDQIEPMRSPLENLQADFTRMRQDQRQPDSHRQQILANAPDAKVGFFCVPKVID